MRIRISLFLLVLAISSIELSAQEKYDKPINKIGKDEAFKLVNDSPWAKSYQSNTTAVARQQGQPGLAGGFAVQLGGGAVARVLPCRDARQNAQ